MSSDPPSAVSRCTLCPAGCEVEAVRTGPGTWRVDVPREAGRGCCPRGSALVELMTHRRRILYPALRAARGCHATDLNVAMRTILSAASGKGVSILLDGNVPAEQMAKAAAWCRAWDDAAISFVLEPTDEQLLLGTEASGAEYLADEELATCDGFVIVGDAFAANPRCARGVLDRRQENRRTPVVAIDPAAGTAIKFATHHVDVAPGGEADALRAVAKAAGAEVEPPDVDDPSAQTAGRAITDCTRLGVLLAAEYARDADWRQVGYLAGELAEAKGGGVAPQTVGANALAALRVGHAFGARTLAESLADTSRVRVAVGCDPVGITGRGEARAFAAAAALPNATTELAEVILPAAMSSELEGTYLLNQKTITRVSPLLSPPAGVMRPAQVVAALASAAGVARPAPAKLPDLTQRIAPEPPQRSPTPTADGIMLLACRQAARAGSGALTGHSSWLSAAEALPELTVSPEDAAAAGLKHLAPATVTSDGRVVQVRVRVAPELPAGRVVLPEGHPPVRSLIPCRADAPHATQRNPISLEH